MARVAALGRALAAPFTSLGGWYVATARARPFLTGVVTSGVKTSFADAFAQKVVEGREEMDWTRHAVFCTFGFAYLGGFQYWLYNVKFAQWCGPITARFGHRGSAPVKVFLDQALHHPLIYFPTFFTLKAAVSGKPLSTAVAKYRTEIWDSTKALWAVWVPAQLVNFSLVPRHMRIPFVSAVSFGWCVILSTMQSRFDGAKGGGGGGAAAAASAAGAAVASTAAPPAGAAAAAAAAPAAATCAATPQPARLAVRARLGGPFALGGALGGPFGGPLLPVRAALA